jgi:uncharacterized protein
MSLRLIAAIALLGVMSTLLAARASPSASGGKSGSFDSPPNSKGQETDAEQVRFASSDNVLAGVLHLPKKRGPHPAVVMVLGSGRADRTYGGDATALARHFASQGFACLSWDKPGVGESTGDYHKQTFRDRADEALAAVAFLRKRSDICPDRVGLWGHSQGAAVAPLAASRSEHVAWIISVAGWHGPAWQQDAVRVEAEMRADGCPAGDIADAVAFAKKRMDLIRGSGPFDELDRAQEAVKALPWFAYVHRCDRALFESGRRMVGEDTGAFWEGVRCPVLVIYGDKDTSAGPADPLVAVIRRGMAKADNKALTIRVFADADHSLHPTKTGSRKEAAERAKGRQAGSEFAPGYLEAMTDWLEKRK